MMALVCCSISVKMEVLNGFIVIIHGRRREMGLGALRNVSLKKARECANQWRSVLYEGRAPKEGEKQKHESISRIKL